MIDNFDTTIKAKFNPDLTYESTLLSRRLPYQMLEDGSVQVAYFQPLTCYRTSEWGWVMKNEHVLLEGE
jgi:hypothetical protein